MTRLTSARGGRPQEEGTVSLMLAVLFTAGVLFAGLIYDVGRAQHASGDAFDLAGQSARAGAQQIDLTALDTSGVVRLDPDRARQATVAYLAAHHAEGHVAVAGTAVTVSVTEHVRYRLLALLRTRGATVTQTRTAVATAGP